MKPGEYSSPLARVAQFEFPVVAGFTTARWRNLRPGLIDHNGDGDVESAELETGETGLCPNATRASILFRNQGSNSVTIQLVVSDIIGGLRANLGSPITLNPLGVATSNVAVANNILEVSCTSGTSLLSGQIESLSMWETLAFDRTDPVYPRSLWVGKDRAPFATS